MPEETERKVSGDYGAAFQNAKNTVVSDIERLISLVREGLGETPVIQKKLQDVQTYWGQERTIRESLEREIEAKNTYIDRLEQGVQDLKEHYSKSQWYLGEERTKRDAAEKELAASRGRCEELQARVRQLEKELSEAQWYLGEERSRQP